AERRGPECARSTGGLSRPSALPLRDAALLGGGARSHRAVSGAHGGLSPLSLSLRFATLIGEARWRSAPCCRIIGPYPSRGSPPWRLPFTKESDEWQHGEC